MPFALTVSIDQVYIYASRVQRVKAPPKMGHMSPVLVKGIPHFQELEQQMFHHLLCLERNK